MPNITTKQFDHWLTSYGSAWEAKHADDFAAMFSAEARYYWTPFGEPRRGRAEIATAFAEGMATQRGIHFVFEILCINGNSGIAHWKCSFERATTDRIVQIDGILKVQINRAGLCEEIKVWWHSDE